MISKTDLTLKNCLLVAMPSLNDSYFKQAVIYIFEHSKDGAMGMVINKLSDMTLDGIFEHLEIPVDHPEDFKHPVLQGGPVAGEHGFILHREPNKGNGVLANKEHNIVISASKEDLITIPQSHFEDVLVSLGYAGWGSGQLEVELKDNSWIVVPFNEAILFDIPFEQRWREAAKLIGVDIDRLVGDIGHA